jgi:hypothetical protein
MSRIMVRYKVKPDLAETNAELVRAVYEDARAANAGPLTPEVIGRVASRYDFHPA